MVQDSKIGDQAFDVTLLGERTFGNDTSFPSTWHENGWFLRIDEGKLYQNTGTEGTPIWTVRLEAANIGIIFALGD